MVRALFFTLFFLLGSSQAFSSHVLGHYAKVWGIGNDSFVVEFVLIRDCSGIFAPAGLKYVYMDSCSRKWTRDTAKVVDPAGLLFMPPTGKSICNGKANTRGAEEFRYRDTLHLPRTQCLLWKFVSLEETTSMSFVNGPSNISIQACTILYNDTTVSRVEAIEPDVRDQEIGTMGLNQSISYYIRRYSKDIRYFYEFTNPWMDTLFRFTAYTTGASGKAPIRFSGFPNIYQKGTATSHRGFWMDTTYGFVNFISSNDGPHLVTALISKYRIINGDSTFLGACYFNHSWESTLPANSTGPSTSIFNDKVMIGQYTYTRVRLSHSEGLDSIINAAPQTFGGAFVQDYWYQNVSPTIKDLHIVLIGDTTIDPLAYLKVRAFAAIPNGMPFSRIRTYPYTFYSSNDSIKAHYHYTITPTRCNTLTFYLDSFTRNGTDTGYIRLNLKHHGLYTLYKGDSIQVSLKDTGWIRFYVETMRKGQTSSYCLVDSLYSNLKSNFTAAITGPGALCLGDSSVFKIHVTGNYSPYTYRWINNLSTSDSAYIRADTAGTRTFYVLVTDSLGCQRLFEKSFWVVGPLVSKMDTLSTYKCVDAPKFALHGKPIASKNYRKWSGPGVDSTMPRNFFFDPKAAGIGVHTIYFTYMDSIRGCFTLHDSMKIEVRSSPVVDAGPDDTACFYDLIPRRLRTGTPVGGKWTGPGIVNDSIFNPKTISSYTRAVKLFYTYNDTGGCSIQDSLTLTLDSLPSIKGQADTYMCINSGRYKLSSTPTATSWSGKGINYDSVNQFTFDPAAAGTGTHYIYCYIYTPGGCWSRDEVRIDVLGIAATDAGTDQSYCVNDPKDTLYCWPSGGSWTGWGVTGNGIFTPASAGLGVHKLVYTYTTWQGCSSSDTVEITVTNALSADAGRDTSICINDTLPLSGYPSGGTYTGPGLSGAVFIAKTAGTGIHKLYYNYSGSSGGCNARDSIRIRVVGLPYVQTQPDTQICFSSAPLTLSSNRPTGIWSGAVTGTNTFDPAVQGIGTHLLFLTYTDGNGCSNSDSLKITVNPLPAISFRQRTFKFCQGAPIAVPEPFPTGGTWLNGKVKNDTIATDSLSMGMHWFRYLYKDGKNCSQTDSVLVEIIAPPTFDLGPDTSLCAGNPFIDFGLGYDQGNWNRPEASGDTIYTAGMSPGIYEFIYTTAANSFCTYADTIQISIHGVPLVDAGHDTVLCFHNGPYLLNGNPAGGHWKDEAGNLTDSLVNPLALGKGTFGFVYTYTNANGCEDRDTVTIIISDQALNARINISGNLRIADTIYFDPQFKGGSSYFWNFGDPASGANNTSFLPDPKHVYNTVGIYTVSLLVKDSFTCEAYDTALLNITPNGIYAKERTMGLRCYPNPFTSEVYFEAEEPIAEICIYDMHGRLIESIPANSDKWRVNLSEEANALYHYRLLTTSGKTYHGNLQKID